MQDPNKLLAKIVRRLRTIGTDTQLVEVKEAAWKLPESIGETLSAFMNHTGGILILGWTAPESFPCLSRYRLTQTVTEPAYARQLSAYGKNIDVHIKIDTGMHRLGIDPEDIASVEEVFTLPHLRVRGMYTHLCVSDALDEASRAFTEAQRRRFFALAEELCRRGYCVGKLHTQSSYGLLNYPDARCSYARVGIALYGVRSFRGDDAACWPDLEPALSLKARVEQVRSVKAG